jgi:acyl carrier protein
MTETTETTETTEIPAAADTVEAVVLDVLSDVLAVPIEALRSRPRIGQHGWHSLTSLEALVQLEQRLDVALDLREFHQVREVADLVALVHANRGVGRR